MRSTSDVRSRNARSRARLAVEHLGQQVVADHAVVARELGDEALGVLAALEAQRGQPQAGAPALGAGVQRADEIVASSSPCAASSSAVSSTR